MSSTNGHGDLPIAMQPRRGNESVWEFTGEAIQPMPNFGSRPASDPYRDPDRRAWVRDVLAAGAIALVLLCAVGLYVSGVFAHQGAKPVPAQMRDPFSLTGEGGSK